MNDLFGGCAKQLFSNGYEVLPVEPRDKAVKIKNWPNVVIDTKQVDEWIIRYQNHSIGIRGKLTPAIDIDICDADAADCVERAVFGVLKTFAPVRVGLPPKRLIVCRTETPFRKIRREFIDPKGSAVDAHGKNYGIEILGDGQQFVAFGVHPDTQKPYTWITESLLDIDVKDLPLINASIAQQIIDIATEELKKLGWSVASGPSVAQPTANPDDDFDGFKQKLHISEEKIDEILSKIPNDISTHYDVWTTVGMGLWHQFDGSPEGYEKWVNWSEKGPKHNEEQMPLKWSSFVPDGLNRVVTFASAVKLAKDAQNLLPDEEKNQVSRLVSFVKGRMAIFHDKNSEVYAQDNKTREVRSINSRQFKNWLVASFYSATGKTLREQAIKEAVSTLSGIGRHDGECRDVYLRVADHDNCYYLDLAEGGNSRAVCISDVGWKIINDPPVMFIRQDTLRPLPEPESGGDITELWSIANIPKECRLLVLAWLCECLRTDRPFPLLELVGEQGSAKSTTQTALRKLIDPNACDLRSAPKAVEDIFVGAGANWIVSYENISYLSAQMQDALCVLATGGGFAKRKLYSDNDESVIHVKRPIILNGICVAVTAQDLVDRTVSIETPRIAERTEVTELWDRFDQQHGKLLGALLDIMVNALANLPFTQLPKTNRPRLVEFVHLGMAVAEALGEPSDAFMQQFNASREEAIARTIDASPVGLAVITWLGVNPKGKIASVTELMSDIAGFRSCNNEMWPRTPKSFADALRRIAPALRQMGIECRSMPKTGGIIRWEVKPLQN